MHSDRVARQININHQSKLENEGNAPEELGLFSVIYTLFSMYITYQ